MYAIGLMSGTSLDGVDACLVKINELKKEKYQIVGFVCYPYEAKFKEKLLSIVLNNPTPIEVICSLNVELSVYYIKAIEKLLKETGVNRAKIKFIAMHGQTVWHHPKLDDKFQASTLQLGDAAKIAAYYNTTVISNFRTMDVAVGGEGAPLVPFANYILYSSKKENIALQNIGGIGNVTYLKKNGKLDDIIAFDTGPGNILIDQAMRKLFGLEFDNHGEIAKSGMINNELLEILLKDKYLTAPIPKSTGREKYNEEFLNKVLGLAKEFAMTNEDIIATLSAYTADTICNAYYRYLGPIDKIILSGGGAHNDFIVNRIKKNFKARVQVIDETDSLEAFSFAIMGYYTLKHRPSNVPSVTGAKRKVVLGEITNPYIKY